MRQAKKVLLAAALLAAVVWTAGFSGGCGPASGAASGPASGAATLSGSAAARAETILGHAPTGLAKSIIDKGVLIVANDANYPPQSYTDRTTHELTGFDVDVAKATAALLGLGVQWKHTSWAIVAAGLDKGAFDVSIGSVSDTGTGTAEMAFTKPYYYTFGQVFVKKGGPQISGPSDLTGKTVGVGAPTVFFDYLKKHTTAVVRPYTNDVAALPDLLSGAIDFWMTSGQTGQQAIKQGKAIEFSGRPLCYQRLCFATKPGEADLSALLDYAIAKMRADGQLRELSKQWYGLDLTVKQ